ncbi:MAG: hypothetical protein WEB09_10560 [Nitriliruptor sp.]
MYELTHEHTTRQDARRRARLFVALYGICLVGLLIAGAWMAPASAYPEGRAPNGGWLEQAPTAGTTR